MTTVTEYIESSPLEYQDFLTSKYTSYYDFFNATVYSDIAPYLTPAELSTVMVVKTGAPQFNTETKTLVDKSFRGHGWLHLPNEVGLNSLGFAPKWETEAVLESL